MLASSFLHSYCPALTHHDTLMLTVYAARYTKTCKTHMHSTSRSFCWSYYQCLHFRLSVVGGDFLLFFVSWWVCETIVQPDGTLSPVWKSAELSNEAQVCQAQLLSIVHLLLWTTGIFNSVRVYHFSNIYTIKPQIQQSVLVASPHLSFLDPVRSPLSVSFSHYTICRSILSNCRLIGHQDLPVPFEFCRVTMATTS